MSSGSVGKPRWARMRWTTGRSAMKASRLQLHGLDAQPLRAAARPLELSHPIPPVTAAASVDASDTDSDAEVTFATLCRKRGFPVPPVAQQRVSFDDGSYTLADWAYPDSKVLVFIDGMSADLHGDPAQQQRDRLLRAKARLKNWQVLEITAEALDDDGSLAVKLQELAIYLGLNPDDVPGGGSR